MRWKEIYEASKHDPKVFRSSTIDHEENMPYRLPKHIRNAEWKLSRHENKKMTKGYDDVRPVGGDAGRDNDDTKAIMHASNDTGHLNSYLLDKHMGKDQSESISKMREPIIAAISKAISNSTPLKNETHVYHGTRLDPTTIEKNGIVYFPTFISTSFHPLVAKNFATAQKDHRNILHFILPAGFHNGMNIFSVNRSSEAEYLLNKDSKWKIINHHTEREKYSLYGGNEEKYWLRRQYKGLVNIWTLIPI